MLGYKEKLREKQMARDNRTWELFYRSDLTMETLWGRLGWEYTLVECVVFEYFVHKPYSLQYRKEGRDIGVGGSLMLCYFRF